MSVSVIATQAREVRQLVNWGIHFARARETDLVVLYPVSQPGETRLVDLDLDLTDDDDNPVETELRTVLRDRGTPKEGDPAVTLRKVMAPDPVDAVLRHLEEEGSKLLVVPYHRHAKGDSPETALQRRLYKISPCDTILLRPGEASGEACDRILLPTAGGPHAGAALRLAASVVNDTGGFVDALFVEPHVGDDAELVGRHIVEGIIKKTLGSNADRVNPTVVLANDVFEGIATAAKFRDYELLIIGASNQSPIRRFLFGTVPESLLSHPEGMSVAVMRCAPPLTARLRRTLEGLLRTTVPQLDREERISLVERVQSNSQWDFDFVALIFLSTAIAALGLVQDSAAVVIGAMLVAPLMTPLLGAGLSLVQGNTVLIKSTTRSILFGFLTAFAVGYLIGVLVPGIEATDEMLSRTRPNILDLAVAFVSGIAAAYATSRPNLSSALPGVAIAAALVPPIASSGLLLANDMPVQAAGAALLFFTNVVAIILGGSLAMFAVGIRGNKKRAWVQKAVGGLIATATLLAIPLGWVLYSTLHGGADPVPAVLVRNLEDEIDQIDQAHLDGVFRIGDEPIELEVRIAAPSAPPAALADALSIVATAHYGRSTRVRLVTSLVSESSP